MNNFKTGINVDIGKTDKKSIPVSNFPRKTYFSENIDGARLTAFRVKNFRNFSDTDWIQLGSLNLFLGENSSGKTAIIQPLEMLSLAYQKRMNEEVFECLEGVQSICGDFEDLYYNNAEENQIKFYFMIQNKTLHIEYELGISGDSEHLYGSVSRVGMTMNEVYHNLQDNYHSNCLFFLRRNSEHVSDDYIESAVVIINSAMARFAEQFQIVKGQRIEPARDMQLTGKNSWKVGNAGQETYNILGALSARGESLKLVDEWLAKFGYTGKWEMTRPNLGSFMLENIKTKHSTNIIDNGFGISQSLPVAVAIDTLPQNGILAIDSPEVFLQTKMQSEMGDLLIEGSKRGTLIVETGSEYILYRVILRILMEEVPEENVKFYFIENDETGEAKCIHLKLEDMNIELKGSEQFSNFFSSDFNDIMEIEKIRIRTMKEQ